MTLKGRLGVPVVERKSLTKPVAPTMTELKPKKSEEESVKREFRARPPPKDILEGVKVSTTVFHLTCTCHLLTTASGGAREAAC